MGSGTKRPAAKAAGLVFSTGHAQLPRHRCRDLQLGWQKPSCRSQSPICLRRTRAAAPVRFGAAPRSVAAAKVTAIPAEPGATPPPPGPIPVARAPAAPRAPAADNPPGNTTIPAYAQPRGRRRRGHHTPARLDAPVSTRTLPWAFAESRAKPPSTASAPARLIHRAARAPAPAEKLR